MFATNPGARVPVTGLVDVSYEPTPLGVLRVDGRRAATVTARLAEGATVDVVAAALTPRLDALSTDWPQGYAWRLRGEIETAAETFGSAGIALGLALAAVGALLTLQFRSGVRAAIVMATAPLALTGVGLGFWIMQIPMSFPAFVGVIALIGIVVNNAIVILEVVDARLRDGLSPAAAAAAGAGERLRPILTTTVTTLAGLGPLALASPTWFPLCMAIVFGLSLSTVVGLVVVPALVALAVRQAASAT